MPMRTIVDIHRVEYTMVTHEAARRVGARAEKCEAIYAETLDGYVEEVSTKYYIPLIDREGYEVMVRALGVCYVGGAQKYGLPEDVVRVLQDLAIDKEGRRASVEVIDLVIGSDYMDWLPESGWGCYGPDGSYQQIKSCLDPKHLWIDTNDEEGRHQAPA